MAMFEMSDEVAAEWRQQLRDLAAPHVNGEEVVSAAGFRRGGAEATLVGIGVRDDPVSQELIGVLTGAAPAAS